jgi:hypothetical protein
MGAPGALRSRRDGASTTKQPSGRDLPRDVARHRQRFDLRRRRRPGRLPQPALDGRRPVSLEGARVLPHGHALPPGRGDHDTGPVRRNAAPERPLCAALQPPPPSSRSCLRRALQLVGRPRRAPLRGDVRVRAPEPCPRGGLQHRRDVALVKGRRRGRAIRADPRPRRTRRPRPAAHPERARCLRRGTHLRHHRRGRPATRARAYGRA